MELMNLTKVYEIPMKCLLKFNEKTYVGNLPIYTTQLTLESKYVMIPQNSQLPKEYDKETREVPPRFIQLHWKYIP